MSDSEHEDMEDIADLPLREATDAQLAEFLIDHLKCTFMVPRAIYPETKPFYALCLDTRCGHCMELEKECGCRKMGSVWMSMGCVDAFRNRDYKHRVLFDLPMSGKENPWTIRRIVEMVWPDSVRALRNIPPGDPKVYRRFESYPEFEEEDDETKPPSAKRQRKHGYESDDFVVSDEENDDDDETTDNDDGTSSEEETMESIRRPRRAQERPKRPEPIDVSWVREQVTEMNERLKQIEQKCLPTSPSNPLDRPLSITEVLEEMGVDDPSEADLQKTGAYALQICKALDLPVPPYVQCRTYKKREWTSRYKQRVLVPAVTKLLEKKRARLLAGV